MSSEQPAPSKERASGADEPDWLSFLAEQTEAGWWQLWPDARRARLSAQASRLLGCAEATDESGLLAALHPLDRGAAEGAWRSAAAKGEGATFEVCARLAVVTAGPERQVRLKGRVAARGPGGPRIDGVAQVLPVSSARPAGLWDEPMRERFYLEHLPVGVWFVDSEGRIIYGNAAGRQIWAGARYVGPELFGEYKAWRHGTGEPVGPQDWGAARAIRNGETSLDEVLDIQCFDGSRKTILNSAVPVRDADGRVAGAVVFNQDITALKEAEKRLTENERTLRSFYDSSPLLMGVVELAAGQGEIVHVYDNKATERLFDAPGGGMAGRTARELGASADDVAFWIASYRESERLGQPVQFERAFQKGGRVIWLLCVVACIGPAGGGRTRFSYVAKDITERKLTELALRDAQARLQEHASQLEQAVAERTAELREASEQLETFVYSVAHDLRGPLRAVTGFAQLLVEDYAEKLDPTARHMLERIQGASEFMDRLVIDLLTFGRVARARIELEPVSVAKAWEQAWFQCAVEAERSRAKVEVIEPLPCVRGHEATLGQMLANLLGNALKFVADGATPEVRLRAEPRGEWVRLWVEDNGIGIAPDQRERVFRVFERLHGTRYGGTGVGLAIVRKGAERMGGRTGVESEPGKGSRFWIELRRAP